MDTTLEQKLATAEQEAARAHLAHQQASLAAEEGGSAAALTKAAKDLHAADTRVSQLRDALTAANEREAQRLADEAAAQERANRAAVNGALIALNEAAAAWDAVVDALVDATKGIEAAADALHHHRPTPDVHQKVARAEAVMLRIIEERLEFYGGRKGLGWSQEMASLVHHLPQPEAGSTPNPNVDAS